MRFTLFRDRRRMEKSALKPCTEIDVHCGGTLFLLRLFIFIESVHSLPLFCKKRNGFSSAVCTAPSVTIYSSFDLSLTPSNFSPLIFRTADFIPSSCSCKIYTERSPRVFAYRLKILALPAEAFTVFTVDFFHSFTLQYINYRKLR